MQTSNRGLAEIAGHEGIALTAYQDTKGVWTIGLGHTAAAGPPDPRAKVYLSLDEAMVLFRKDIAKFEAEVNAAVRVPLAQHEFDALVSFHYNTGGIGRAKLTAALNRGDREEAIKGFLGWLQPPEIASRRKAEQALFATGKYGDGKATLFRASASGMVVSSGTRLDVLAALEAETATPAPDPAPVPEVAPITAGARVSGTSNGLNLRASPPDGTVLATLPEGHPVEILDTWHRVTVVVDGQSRKGWMAARYVADATDAS